jgi:hypothetical protein
MIWKTVRVSERVYGILDYGSKVYGESMGEYMERLLEALCERERLLELKSHDVFKIELKSHISESEHSELIKEGLSLIAEINSEKGKELEKKLLELNSQKSHEESKNKLLENNALS